MDSPKLRALSRTQLQSLAKREVVRAVGKTEDIIRRLIQKHPRGVPIPIGADNPSVPLSPVPESLRNQADSKGKGKQIEASSPSPSSSSEALEQLLYPEDEIVAAPSNTHQPEVAESQVQTHAAHNGHGDARRGAPPRDASNPGWQAEEDDQSDDDNYYADYPKGAPSHYMVIDALRQFTTLVNNIPSMEARIDESRCLLRRTAGLLEQATPESRELAVTREYLETFLLGKMKQKRELWDGTGRMEKESRKVRMEWLRAERRAESEKKWNETKELYEKKGLKPEPLSAFLLESDEESIESLQTTPASSGRETSKRTREESESGEDADSEDEYQRKRARAG